MTHRELMIGNLTGVLPRLPTLDKNHRYIRGYYQCFTGRYTDREFTETDKAYVIAELEAYVDKIKGLTDAEYNLTRESDTGCGSPMWLHLDELDPEVVLWDKLAGPDGSYYRVVEKIFTESADGRTAEKKLRASQVMANGDVVDKGWYVDSIGE
jgi:hypothetical protein